MSDTLLRVEDLKIYYPVAGSGFGKKEFVKAVDGVTFEVKKGEVFGIVGESGCGKSTLGRGVCKLENLTSGHVYLDGEDITEYNDRRMRSIRKKVQMVFQDPYASLNPRMSVFDIIAEPLLVHHLYQDKADLEKKVLDLLHRVGLDDYHANRYPHEFSGGQRQRKHCGRNAPCSAGIWRPGTPRPRPPAFLALPGTPIQEGAEHPQIAADGVVRQPALPH